MRPISQLEQATALDRVVAPGQRIARALRPGPVRDALHGVWLGHPLHPVLAQAPVGAWMSAAVLDAGSSTEGEAQRRRLVAFGLMTAAAAALAGAADWSEQHEQQMRVGVVHAAANVTGGLLGGHISFRLSGGANQAEPVPHLVEPGWHDLMPAAGLPDGDPVKAMLGDVPLVVIRDGSAVHVLAGRCSHLSGPLFEGEVDGGCLICPWHGTAFRIADGSVARGPATAPQPVLRTRIRDGVIQVCLPDAG